MTVYFCDRCGKRVWRENSQMHIISISDSRAHRERILDICAECIDVFWKELPRNNGTNMMAEEGE